MVRDDNNGNDNGENDLAGIIGHGEEAKKRKKEFCETFPVSAQLRWECE